MSESDSPLATPVTLPSGTLSTLPSSLRTALSKESLVRVLASKNAVMTILPSSGLAISISVDSSRAASFASSTTSARLKSLAWTMDRPRIAASRSKSMDRSVVSSSTRGSSRMPREFERKGSVSSAGMSVSALVITRYSV